MSGSVSEHGNLTALGLGSFLAFVILGLSSETINSAIDVASDILPLREDVQGLMGLADGDASGFDLSRALPGLVALVVIIVVTLLAPPIRAGFFAASDILPFPGDLQEAITGGETD